MKNRMYHSTTLTDSLEIFSHSIIGVRLGLRTFFANALEVFELNILSGGRPVNKTEDQQHQNLEYSDPRSELKEGHWYPLLARGDN